MKDRQSNARGRCTQCECAEYCLPQEGHACDYCDHKPTSHILAEDAKLASPLAQPVAATPSLQQSAPIAIARPAQPYVPSFYGFDRKVSVRPSATSSANSSPVSTAIATPASLPVAPHSTTASPASLPLAPLSTTASPASLPVAPHAASTTGSPGLRSILKREHAEGVPASPKRVTTAPMTPIELPPVDDLSPSALTMSSAEKSDTAVQSELPSDAPLVRLTAEELDVVLRMRNSPRRPSSVLNSGPVLHRNTVISQRARSISDGGYERRRSPIRRVSPTKNRMAYSHFRHDSLSPHDAAWAGSLRVSREGRDADAELKRQRQTP
eukprot:TRINITY_DN14300_c0_g1_i1.p1 TRINITY_DN14300_c0_g1~~TRINITY_DN14300_c0_g1_i1.p1  ORF type:complete len:325 (-),score=40.28 TRINITY_DN14300_c0_g1_i1:140-1114(-)